MPTILLAFAATGETCALKLSVLSRRTLGSFCTSLSASAPLYRLLSLSCSIWPLTEKCLASVHYVCLDEKRETSPLTTVQSVQVILHDPGSAFLKIACVQFWVSVADH